MYKLIVKQIVRRNFRSLSRGDFDKVVRKFATDIRFRFAGDHALGGERRGREAARAWFVEAWGRFGGLQLEPLDVVVNGWPWNTRVATRFQVHTTLPDGRPYDN